MLLSNLISLLRTYSYNFLHLGHVKATIFKKWAIPLCQQMIIGWSAKSDDELLKDLNLKSPVQLSVGAGDTPKNHPNAMNGVNTAR